MIKLKYREGETIMRKIFILLSIFSLTLGIFTGCSKEVNNKDLNKLDISSIINADYKVEILNITDIYESNYVN